jgi:hypothetical protein
MGHLAGDLIGEAGKKGGMCGYEKEGSGWT